MLHILGTVECYHPLNGFPSDAKVVRAVRGACRTTVAVGGHNRGLPYPDRSKRHACLYPNIRCERLRGRTALVPLPCPWVRPACCGDLWREHLCLRSRPPHPPGQNGGVARAIESLEQIRAIKVMTDRSSSRAATYVLLCYPPQVADMPQDAEYKRVQTPQAAALAWPGVYPAESLTPQVAQVTNISKDPETVSSIGLTPQVEEIVEEKKASPKRPSTSCGRLTGFSSRASYPSTLPPVCDKFWGLFEAIFKCNRL